HLGFDFGRFLKDERPPRRLGPATWFLIRVAATFGAKEHEDDVHTFSRSDQDREAVGSMGI
ncbi:hypothetical protein OAH18_01675, partial [bacterium]|nr:hypothetical protein [bacterium]